MKIAYLPGSRKNPAAFAIRSVLTAWLIAGAYEYWILGAQLGNLAGLDGIATMSAGRMMAIGGGVFLVLWLLRGFLFCMIP